MLQTFHSPQVETMNEDQTPTWRPLGDLPLIASMIDGMLADTQEQYQNLLAVKDRPHVLDTPLVERIEAVYTTQAGDFWLYEEQLAHWRRESLSEAQGREITRLEERFGELRAVNDRILALAAEFKEGTIDKILAKDDIELAFEFLSGKRKL